MVIKLHWTSTEWSARRGYRKRKNKIKVLPEEKGGEYPYYKLAHLELAPP